MFVSYYHLSLTSNIAILLTLMSFIIQNIDGTWINGVKVDVAPGTSKDIISSGQTYTVSKSMHGGRSCCSVSRKQKAESVISGDRKTYDGDHLTGSGNHCHFHGDFCTVTGNHNTLSGDYCTVSGDDNVISGDFCNASGTGNTFSGDYCTVSGDDNVMSGDFCNASGTGNTCSGDYCRCNHRTGSPTGITVITPAIPIVGGNVQRMVLDGDHITMSGIASTGDSVSDYDKAKPKSKKCRKIKRKEGSEDEGAITEEKIPGILRSPIYDANGAILPDDACKDGERGCPICLTNSVKLAFTECGHAYCFECSRKLIDAGDVKCSICKTEIHKRMLRIYV
jgi:hypothetical protein